MELSVFEAGGDRGSTTFKRETDIIKPVKTFLDIYRESRSLQYYESFLNFFSEANICGKLGHVVPIPV